MSRDIPIIFSAPMIKAFLREIETPGTGKTMTRRLAWREDGAVDVRYGKELAAKGWRVEARDSTSSYAWSPTQWQKVKPGDRLWVRESVKGRPDEAGFDGVQYLADNKWAAVTGATPNEMQERFMDLFYYRNRRGAPIPSIHMPRWASRITLIVTATKTEPVQNIVEADAIAEGVQKTIKGHFGVIGPNGGWLGSAFDTAAAAFSYLWMSLHGTESWDANPEVVALTVKPILANIDSPEARAA